MSKLLRMTILALMALTLALPAAAELEDDPFWDEEDFKEDLMTGTGSGGGPLMIYIPRDFDQVNAQLKVAGLLPVPDQDLQWGGAGWIGLNASEKTFVGLGGGGYGGGTEGRRGDLLTKWTNGGGYFSAKGIYVLHRRLYLEGGVELGGGRSELLVEETSPASGQISVWVRGHRHYVMMRPVVGLDFRVAHWVGFLVRGGYTFTSGEWVLEGDQNLIEQLDFDDADAPFVSVMVRFGL